MLSSCSPEGLALRIAVTDLGSAKVSKATVAASSALSEWGGVLIGVPVLTDKGA